MTAQVQRPDAYSFVAAALVGAGLGLMSLFSPLLAIGLVGATVFGLVVLRYPLVMGYTLIAGVTLLAGITRGKLIPMLRPNEVILVLAIAFTVFVVIADRRRSFAVGRYSFVLTAFGVLFCGSIAMPLVYHLSQGRDVTFDALLNLTSPLKFLATFLVIVTLVRGRADTARVVLWMLICGAIVALVGLLQAAGVGVVRQILASWYTSVHSESALASTSGRVTSLVAAWNTLGMLMMTCVLLGWSALQASSMARHHWPIMGATALCALCLLASGSFAGTLSAIIGIAIIALFNRQSTKTLKRLFLAGAIIGAGLLLTAPISWPVIQARLEYQYGNGGASGLLPSTLVYRFWIWRDVFWPLITEQPIFGASLVISDALRWQWTESQYLLLLFNGGLISLLAHLLWVGLMAFWLLRRARRSDDDLVSMLAICGFALLVVSSIAGVTNEVFLFTSSIDYLWIIFALVVQHREEHAHARSA
ncbi:MAG: hypothetical protein RMK84_11370 [Oscillochloridaceae bacterium]|nr:hypothetical protein [Chloroflexaceae bacterium]MDW8390714.1 hypothetical protein [Oscillochloridaceae bacterium]